MNGFRGRGVHHDREALQKYRSTHQTWPLEQEAGLTSWTISTKLSSWTRSGSRIFKRKAQPQWQTSSSQAASPKPSPRILSTRDCLRLWGTFLTQSTMLCTSKRQKWMLVSWSKWFNSDPMGSLHVAIRQGAWTCSTEARGVGRSKRKKQSGSFSITHPHWSFLGCLFQYGLRHLLDLSFWNALEVKMSKSKLPCHRVGIIMLLFLLQEILHENPSVCELHQFLQYFPCERHKRPHASNELSSSSHVSLNYHGITTWTLSSKDLENAVC